ncbi:hypothetical protein CHELA1G2_14039 [Hyphomicrobiales bacterium]|nr:hypothetical protein CHELA1G2_14039 [Hyphomicrobiales bacterium]
MDLRCQLSVPCPVLTCHLMPNAVCFLASVPEPILTRKLFLRRGLQKNRQTRHDASHRDHSRRGDRS